jgi:hypothetical protein
MAPSALPPRNLRLPASGVTGGRCCAKPEPPVRRAPTAFDTARPELTHAYAFGIRQDPTHEKGALGGSSRPGQGRRLFGWMAVNSARACGQPAAYLGSPANPLPDHPLVLSLLSMHKGRKNCANHE